jgi:hypothetical protein
MARLNGSAFFKKGIIPPPEENPQEKAVKIELKPSTENPNERKAPENEEKAPVKNPSKAVENAGSKPDKESGSIFDFLGWYR